MNLFFIERYIKKIQKEDIYKYALSQGITLTNKELDILYTYLKMNYKSFLTTPELRPQLLSEIKSQVTPLTATKIDELYNQYKYKI